MKKKLLWKFDMLIYRLFYWRWSPRLRADPDLAYVFSKIGSSWTNGNPPRNAAKMDQFMADVFAKHGKVNIRMIPSDGETIHSNVFITNR